MFLAHPTGMMAYIEEGLLALVPDGLTCESADALTEVVAGGFFVVLLQAPLHCDPATEWRVIRTLAAALLPAAVTRVFPLFAGAKAEGLRQQASELSAGPLSHSPEWTALAHQLAVQFERRLVGCAPGAGESVQARTLSVSRRRNAWHREWMSLLLRSCGRCAFVPQRIRRVDRARQSLHAEHAPRLCE